MSEKDLFLLTETGLGDSHGRLTLVEQAIPKRGLGVFLLVM